VQPSLISNSAIHLRVCRWNRNQQSPTSGLFFRFQLHSTVSRSLSPRKSHPPNAVAPLQLRNPPIFFTVSLSLSLSLSLSIRRVPGATMSAPPVDVLGDMAGLMSPAAFASSPPSSAPSTSPVIPMSPLFLAATAQPPSTPFTAAIQAQAQAQQAQSQEASVAPRPPPAAAVLKAIPVSQQALQDHKAKFKVLFGIETQRRLNASLSTMKNLQRDVKVTTKAKPTWILPEGAHRMLESVTPEWMCRANRGDSGVENSKDVRDIYLEIVTWLNETIAYHDQLAESPRNAQLFAHLNEREFIQERENNRVLTTQLLLKVEESMRGFKVLTEQTYQDRKKQPEKDAFESVREEIQLEIDRCRRIIQSWPSTSL
jgi:hypothetical protein